ncbi:MAG: hypothetical protein QOJ65_837, partial [Fimbriimonadaceae bacterium]|nr:hypothetical protein [Fimbriimonadaceae bacterium]
IDAKRYLEIGVFTGYSSLAMALAMPADGRIVACDVSEEYAAMAKRYWAEAGVQDRIDLRIAPALETLDAMIGSGQRGSFDIAFIDADKTNIPSYLDRCLELIRQNGLIMIDNTLRDGRVLKPEGEDEDTVLMHDFNKAVGRDSRVEVLLLPLFDGLTLIRKR